MRSSNKIISANNDVGIIEYQPQKVHIDSKTQSQNFIALQKSDQYESFKIDDLISTQIGLSEAKAKKFEMEVEKNVVEKLKTIEERAYKEAYELGLIEGKKKAYEDYETLIQAQLAKLNDLMESIATMKKKILEANESQMVDLLYYLAKKIAIDHIEANPARIVPVLREVVENLSDEEKIMVRVSEEDLQHIESLKKEMKREFDFLKKINLVSSVDIKSGGCTFETRNGTKDATIEERLEKLWKILDDTKPKTTEES